MKAEYKEVEVVVTQKQKRIVAELTALEALMIYRVCQMIGGSIDDSIRGQFAHVKHTIADSLHKALSDNGISVYDVEHELYMRGSIFCDDIDVKSLQDRLK